MTALCVAAWWGLAADRSVAPTLGEPTEHDGGTFTVVAAWTVGDPMMAMHDTNMSQFAQNGMSMSSMLPDAVPEGFKRVAVEVQLTAGPTPMEFPTESFRLGTGSNDIAPYVALLGDGRLDPGSRLDGVVTFEVPEEWMVATFRVSAGGAPVLVDLTGSNHADDHT